MAKTIAVAFHLVVKADPNQNGYCKHPPTVRACKNKPATDRNEVAIAMRLELPVSLFLRPQLTATITVPEADAPLEIDAQVAQNIADAINEQTGLNVRLEVAAPKGGQPS